MADQPALGPDGQLLDTSKIMWYNNPDDDHPIQPTPDTHHGTVFNLLSLLRDLSVIIIQVTALKVQCRPPQVVHDWLQLLMQRHMMNSATFFNHIANMLVLDNPTTPAALSSEILMHAIQFTGGWVDEPSSQTCSTLLVTFYVYLVSHSSIFTKILCIIFTSRFCCCH